jgi:dinuclear metal center YbgI/SA1388 family protein
MTPRVSDLIEIINTLAPFRYAESWDNVGLQVGDPRTPVTKLMVSLDASADTIAAAITESCQLLLTHHPLIFRPLQRIDLTEPSGLLIGTALRHSLSIVSLHTNFDSAPGGINDLFAKRLGVVATVPLSISRVGELAKLAVFVPRGYEEQVLEALFPLSGFMGTYSDCSFRVNGTGTFRPNAGSTPFIGTLGQRESVEEARIEVLLRKDDVPAAMAVLAKAHPYEEPAVDLYPLINEGASIGLGRIGALEQPMSLDQFVSQIKNSFAVEGIRCVGNGQKLLQRVALCGGSGASLLHEAHRQGADVLVTGDVKYHDARDAEALGIALIDVGHFPSEQLMVEGVRGALESALQLHGYAVELVMCGIEKDPFQWR